jgi:hypothetical protein
MADQVDIRIVGDLQKLALAPTDSVVVRVAGRLTAGQYESIKSQLRQLFPSNECIVLDSAAELTVVSQPAAP